MCRWNEQTSVSCWWGLGTVSMHTASPAQAVGPADRPSVMSVAVDAPNLRLRLRHAQSIEIRTIPTSAVGGLIMQVQLPRSHLRLGRALQRDGPLDADHEYRWAAGFAR